ncbi:MAG TPA: Uma2 family endonuclease [Pirellulales bacterium]|nr:Uma2 family endonuclease [Pirellulales bacterium]
MSIAQPPPSNGPPTAPYRFSVEQYHRMIADGLLAADDRVELLEGRVYHLPPIGPEHAYTVNSGTDVFARLLPAGWHARSQQPITLADSEPLPDLAVIRGRLQDYRRRHPIAADVGLVIEVADSSLRSDRMLKLAIYAAAGIPEYWIVNLVDRQVEVNTKPEPAGRRRAARYAKRRVVGEKGTLTVSLDGNSIGTLAVADLLP